MIVFYKLAVHSHKIYDNEWCNNFYFRHRHMYHKFVNKKDM